ncbi:MAG: hypothetical protein ACKPKO_12495, partial [Candidatus Fonsibacter sp.]
MFNIGIQWQQREGTTIGRPFLHFSTPRCCHVVCIIPLTQNRHGLLPLPPTRVSQHSSQGNKCSREWVGNMHQVIGTLR